MTSQLPLMFELRDDHQLRSFVRGANVELVDQLLGLGCARQPGEVLWIHGAAGCGKTHLLQAMIGHLSEQGAQAAYLPARKLPVEDVPLMLEGTERYTLLVIDDVDVWLGKRSIETELVRLYQERRHAGTHLVFSAQRTPLEYEMALPDWQSRSQGAEVFRLAELTDDGKLQVLIARSARLGLELSDSVGTYLLRHGPRALPKMLDVLARVDRLALSEQRRLTVPLLKKVLENSADNAPPGSPS